MRVARQAERHGVARGYGYASAWISPPPDPGDGADLIAQAGGDPRRVVTISNHEQARSNDDKVSGAGEPHERGTVSDDLRRELKARFTHTRARRCREQLWR